MGEHDIGYRLLFSFRRMVEDLLREFVAEPWVDRLDFSAAQRLNASFVSPQYAQREGDMVWRIETFDGLPVYLYVLLELQSTVDRFMPLRAMIYQGLFYQHLISQDQLLPSGKLPPVIVLILYNGERPWVAPLELSELIERVDPSAEIYLPRLRCRLIDEQRYRPEDLDGRTSPVARVFRLEASLDKHETLEGVARMLRTVKELGDEELQRALLAWLDRRLAKMGLPPARDLEKNMESMLDRRIEQWAREEREKGRLEGVLEGLEKEHQEERREGRREGEAQLLLTLLEQKFGPLDEMSQMRIRSADADLLLDWGKRLIRAEHLADIFGD